MVVVVDVDSVVEVEVVEVEVEVDEPAVARVKVGQESKLSVDAFPDTTFKGVVVEVGNAAQSSGASTDQVTNFLVKILLTDVVPGIKPGMTAKVDILIEELNDVLYVPIQAVSTFEGKRVAYLAQLGREPEKRIVETGQFNDSFIEVKNGLNEGDEVLLIQPETPAGTGEKPAEEKPAEAPSPETVQASAAE